MNPFKYPAMREYVLSALESLSDLDYQKKHWGKYDPEVNFYDDLLLNIHILYDDCQVLPDPWFGVPEYIRASEVESLKRLDAILGPLIEELGNVPDGVYMNHEKWSEVTSAAKEALGVMLD